MSSDLHNSVDTQDTITQDSESSVSAKLLRRVRRANRVNRSKNKSTSQYNFARSDDVGSENSQVLYMRSSKGYKRSSRESLSSISNKSIEIKDTTTDSKPIKFRAESKADDLAWKVIDREIFEWQYVCRTGRPYWWSPESKCLRLKKIQPRVFHVPNPRIWRKEWDDSPKPDYDITRRTMSESYLADPSKIGDVAQLIAIQLLSACFTIPPDHAGTPAPNNMTFGKAKFPDLLEYRMISSLRMHTHFRYSPAFGHQPRNTSPVESWPRTYESYDGPAGNLEASEADIEPPGTALRRQKSRRQRVHRALHMSDDSSSSYNSQDNSQDNRKLRRSSSANGSSSFITDANFTEQRSRRRRPRGRQMPSLNSDEVDADDTSRGYHTTSSKSRNTLTSVLRSEPHPVYIQPVKELVVRRWNGIRRHLKAGLPSNNSGEAKSADATPSTLEPAVDFREAFSVRDGKERRRSARERGDILSSSTEGTPHYNTPASNQTPDSGTSLSALASGHTSPAIDTSGSHSKPSDAVPASTSLQFLSTEDPKLAARPGPGRLSSTRSAPAGEMSNELRTESGYFVTQRAKTSVSFTPRSRRANRRSLLSEVCTPEDFEEIRSTVSSPGPAAGVDRETDLRSVLSTIGSDTSPVDGLPLVLVKSPSPKSIDMEVRKTSSSRDASSSDDQLRPGITRANTSGTQLFTPHEDGVEVDGVPAGPSEKEWEHPTDTEGNQRERSFL
ncbi:hypothetical protein PVAG01_05053 [Phlyctema vagabunda]|uniref:Uncharacterized protein n=1 Tax=Phlyctema vagabunda TaxID=108571 RepID=A0ABR4PK35_9HELO